MIDKEEFKDYILAGTTIPELQIIYGISRTKVAQYKRDFGFVGITPNSRKINTDDGTKHCNKCDTTKSLNEFHANGKTPKGTQKYKAICAKCSNITGRDTWIKFIMDYLSTVGLEYKCNRCNDTDIFGFLDFHHTDPNEKDFNIGDTSKYTSSCESFQKDIVPELNKCILVCPSCHRREHLIMGQK